MEDEITSFWSRPQSTKAEHEAKWYESIHLGTTSQAFDVMEDAQNEEELHAQIKQQIPSPTKGENAQETTIQEVEVIKEQEIPEPQREPTSTPEQSATSAHEKMKQVLQDPQQCI